MITHVTAYESGNLTVVKSVSDEGKRGAIAFRYDPDKKILTTAFSIDDHNFTRPWTLHKELALGRTETLRSVQGAPSGSSLWDFWYQQMVIVVNKFKSSGMPVDRTYVVENQVMYAQKVDPPEATMPAYSEELNFV
jgi:hypothetical protein